MNKTALKKHILYLESRTEDNLPSFSACAKSEIKKRNKKMAKFLRKLIKQ